MPKKKAQIASTKSFNHLPVISDGFAATTAAFQIIWDLVAILETISAASETELGRLAAVGVRVARDSRMTTLDDGHFKLRMNLEEAGVRT